MTVRSGNRYTIGPQDSDTAGAAEKSAGENIICIIHCNHPVAFRTVKDAIQSDPELCSTVTSYSDYYKSLRRTSSEILVLDTCSVERWEEPLEKWQSKGGRAVALISPETTDEIQQLQILCAGALGIISFSDNEIKHLPKAIQAAMEGRRWVKRDILDEYIKRTRYLLKSLFSPENRLTIRESEIFELLQQGFSNKQIANSLSISERTAKFHVSNLLRKYQLGTRRDFLAENSRSATDKSLRLIVPDQTNILNIVNGPGAGQRDAISVPRSRVG